MYVKSSQTQYSVNIPPLLQVVQKLIEALSGKLSNHWKPVLRGYRTDEALSWWSNCQGEDEADLHISPKDASWPSQVFWNIHCISKIPRHTRNGMWIFDCFITVLQKPGLGCEIFHDPYVYFSVLFHLVCRLNRTSIFCLVMSPLQSSWKSGQLYTRRKSLTKAVASHRQATFKTWFKMLDPQQKWKMVQWNKIFVLIERIISFKAKWNDCLHICTFFFRLGQRYVIPYGLCAPSATVKSGPQETRKALSQTSQWASCEVSQGEVTVQWN